MDSFQEFGSKLKANNTAWFLSQIDMSKYSKEDKLYAVPVLAE